MVLKGLFLWCLVLEWLFLNGWLHWVFSSVLWLDWPVCVEWCPECNYCFLVPMVSKAIDGASLGIWNLTIPNLSDAAYERRILGLVVSLKTKSDGWHLWHGLVMNISNKITKELLGCFHHELSMCVLLDVMPSASKLPAFVRVCWKKLSVFG